LKLISDEITVGLANRLAIESYGKFQVDISKGHADATRIAEAQQQRAARDNARITTEDDKHKLQLDG
jgi:hypothetical protein